MIEWTLPFSRLLPADSEDEWKKMRELLAEPSPPNMVKLLFKVTFNFSCLSRPVRNLLALSSQLAHVTNQRNILGHAS